MDIINTYNNIFERQEEYEMCAIIRDYAHNIDFDNESDIVTLKKMEVAIEVYDNIECGDLIDNIAERMKTKINKQNYDNKRNRIL